MSLNNHWELFAGCSFAACLSLSPRQRHRFFSGNFSSFYFCVDEKFHDEQKKHTQWLGGDENNERKSFLIKYSMLFHLKIDVADCSDILARVSGRDRIEVENI